MKKIILEEVNRNRQIMGLKPIVEQWEDNLLKNLGIDVEQILAKAEADLIPVEMNLIKSIEKHAGPDAEQVLRSFGKGSLKNDFPAIFKKLEQEMLSNTDKNISKAFLDSFYLAYPEASRIKGLIDDDALSNMIKDYEKSGMVKQADAKLAEIRKSLDTLPDGAFKDDLLKTFESKYGQTSAKAKVSQQDILRELDSTKAEVNTEIKKFGNGGLSKIYREKANTAEFVKTRNRIKSAIEKLEEMAADPKLLEDFNTLEKTMKNLDAKAIEKVYYKIFGSWAEPLWQKSYLGKVAVISIIMSIAGTVGISIKELFDRCLPIINGIAKFLNVDTSMCSNKEGEGVSNERAPDQPNPSETPSMSDQEISNEFRAWLISKDKGYSNKIQNISIDSKDKTKVTLEFKKGDGTIINVPFKRNGVNDYSKQQQQ